MSASSLNAVADALDSSDSRERRYLSSAILFQVFEGGFKVSTGEGNEGGRIQNFNVADKPCIETADAVEFVESAYYS